MPETRFLGAAEEWVFDLGEKLRATFTLSTAKGVPIVKATVVISTSTGSEILTISLEDYDPFAVLAVRDVTVQLTRDECRKVADALRAATLRKPYDAAPHLLD